jgi:hypothetical protein
MRGGGEEKLFRAEHPVCMKNHAPIPMRKKGGLQSQILKLLMAAAIHWPFVSGREQRIIAVVRRLRSEHWFASGAAVDQIHSLAANSPAKKSVRVAEVLQTDENVQHRVLSQMAGFTIKEKNRRA